MEKSAVVTEKAAAVYQRGRWLVSNISDVRIMWNITVRYGRLHSRARITAAALIQGARVDIGSRQHCCRCPLTTTINAEGTALLFLKEVWKHHGTPRVVV
jgi:hypothetical protein